MSMVNQNYMGRGWTAAEMEEARTEANQADPTWRRDANPATLPGHNHRCSDCEVLWRSESEFTRCWVCGKPPAHGLNSSAALRQTYSTTGSFEYVQPTTPASGCGCDDETVLAVAKLHADGLDFWSACLLVYRDAT